ncbi:MAG: penicillin-binding transpeptidase domain-containing protein [Acidobacteriota bacterium]|nr:penicillin-binding transpeptidase domain-containing protein [Acidobacteriota bacterium]
MKKHFLTISLWVVWITLASFSSFAQDAPPKEENKREADLVELNELDKTIKLDIRYARADNFVGKAVYMEARAFMQRPAAEAVVRVHKKFKKKGFGLVIFDGYRPWSVTKIFWDVTPEDKRKFVANPKTGSRHNRGCAVDLSLFDLKTGELVEMPTDFDDFTDQASPTYDGATKIQKRNRDLLRKMMEVEGFTVNRNEWWHFDYKDWANYAIYDISFSAVKDLDAKISVAEIEEKKDWKKFFDGANVTGGILIYDYRKNNYLVYDRERINRGFAPASTSKIIHSLIFLETGAVKDENEILKWDGVRRQVAAWNQDHNLRSAFKVSAAWFYVEASKRVGRDAMQNYYDLANYGNRSTNGFGRDYWNKGDLLVTQKEQIAFLVRFYENRLPFSKRSIETVKDVLINEKTDEYVLRTKTGWSNHYTPQVGWLVGYVEHGGDVYFFATEIDIKKMRMRQSV